MVKIFYMVCAFFVGMMIFLTTHVIANEDKRVKAMAELTKALGDAENRSAERYLTLSDKISGLGIRISERLGNIEGKLGDTSLGGL